jgi:UDP-N-acetylglucosamine--N-acetylmuramyl-(pentapeptide) pyrophosphoryl-undecaprenol N-acetylglucosamine transferase
MRRDAGGGVRGEGRALRVLFAGGGTGGHLFPGIEVARALVEALPGSSCVFCGAGREAERRALEGTPFRHEVLPAAALPRGPWRFPGFLAALFRSLRAAFARVREIGPDIVVGLGGYASAAPALAAALTGRPVLLLEQNAVPGKANRLLARLARAVFVPWEDAAEGLPRGARVEAVGNPVRRSVLEEIADARERLGLLPSLPTLLVMGGSQGAQGLNRAVLESVNAFAARREALQVIHLAGGEDAPALARAYEAAGVRAHVAPYLARMEIAYSASDFALARAGGTSIAELACRGIPAALVPFPAAAEDHQRRNAEAAARSGGAIVIPEAALAGEGVRRVLALLLDGPVRARMAEAIRRGARPDAAKRIVTRMLEAVHG